MVSIESSASFLPLTNGEFLYEEKAFAIASYFIGNLVLSSGKLVISDPFGGMQKEGNNFIQVSPGLYPVFKTLINTVGNSGHAWSCESYLSIVIDKDLVMRRRFWQKERIKAGLCPVIPDEAIKEFNTSYTGEHADYEEMEPLCCNSVTGVVGMVDAECFKLGMPNNVSHDDWYDTLFFDENEASWFKQIDDSKQKMPGSASIVLPNKIDTPFGDANIVVAHTGLGDGSFPIFGEYSFDYDNKGTADKRKSLVAIHVDFEVIQALVG